MPAQGGVYDRLIFESIIRTEFRNAFDAIMVNKPGNLARLEKLAIEVPSTKREENYVALGTLPKMKEWVDERKLGGMKDLGFSIVNKDFEASIELSLNDIADDQSGMIRQRTGQLALAYPRFLEQAIIDLCANGTADVCYDGQEFFDTTHPVYNEKGEDTGADQSNLVAVATYGVETMTADEAYLHLWAAITAFMAMTDDRGEIMNLVPDTILMNPAYANNVLTITKGLANPVSTNVTGPNPISERFPLDVIIDSRIPHLSGGYYLFHTGVAKPYIKQNRQPLQEDYSDNEKFMSKRVQFGIDCRLGYGYGMWQTALKVA